jgi:XRE family aerobic/anaerobic benzoate catabolism transcriptional regulator
LESRSDSGVKQHHQATNTAEQLDESSQRLIHLVGDRVRVLRTRKKFSRRQLSELSGVSQRYLAQLEGGEGNISVGLLKRLAITLCIPIEALVTEDDLSADELANLLTLYRQSDLDTRARALQQLNPVGTREKKAQRICLVGLRGAGKSTLGQRLGEDLKLPFVELNKEIERIACVPVSELIDLYGQEGYRKFEADALEGIVNSQEHLVLEAAGGIVSNTETYYKLLSRFHTVWIKASAKEHMSRVAAQGDLRPMQDNPQAMVQLEYMLTTREALYGKAEYTLNTAGKSLSDSQVELRQLIANRNILEEY